MEKRTDVIVMGAAGRMGREICRIVKQDAGFRLAGVVDLPEHAADLASFGCASETGLKEIMARSGDSVVIDFTTAGASVKNAAIAAEAGAPIVIGSTGLSDDQKMELAALATTTPILWSANMSVGMNALLRILPALAAALSPSYDMEIVELHHRHKKDAPSGTAMMLGQALARAREWDLDKVRVSGRDGITGERKDEEIGIQAVRGGDVAGIHHVYFFGQGEFIDVTHHAETRENFARGALRAAAWLKNRPAGPLYSMQDVIWEA